MTHPPRHGPSFALRPRNPCSFASRARRTAATTSRESALLEAAESAGRGLNCLGLNWLFHAESFYL